MPGTKRGGLLLLAILAASAGLRAWCFVGWGPLGDDAYYARTAVFLGRGQFDLHFGSNYRLALHLPNALALRLLGVSDLAFVLFPLVSSLATIGVAYLLGERLAGARAGLLAAALVASSPFAAVYSTTMTIDVITSLLSAAAALLLLRSEDVTPRRARFGLVLAALLLFCAYMVKIPALLLVWVLAAYSVTRERPLRRRHAILYAALAVLLGVSCLIDLAVSGDAFGYWAGERRTAAPFVPGLGVRWYLEFYLREMFGASFQGANLFGLTFHAIVPALAYALLRPRPGQRLLVFWLVGLFLLLEFLPNRLSLPYEPVPRYARYLEALVVPGLLLVAFAFDDAMRRHARLAAPAFGLLLAGSVLVAHRTAARVQDGFRDVKLASRFVLSLPPGRVYADSRFLDRLDFDRGYAGPFELRFMQDEIEKRRTPELLASFGPGYVVSGGSRGADVWDRAVFDLGALPPPPHWRLLYTLEGPRRPWRREPLRVFAIGR